MFVPVQLSTVRRKYPNLETSLVPERLFRFENAHRIKFIGTILCLEVAPLLFLPIPRMNVEPTNDSILQHFQERIEDFLALLKFLVEHESPSNHKLLVGAFVTEYRSLLEEVGFHCEEISGPAGPQLFAEKRGAHETASPLVLVGHSDTVWPAGEVERRPPRIKDGKMYGPGIYDMRGGLVLIIAALRFLHHEGRELPCRLQVFLSADEERGSVTAKPQMEHLLSSKATALVVEPPTPDGGLKAERKGVCIYDLKLIGREAHAGAEPEKGASAIHELARQIVAIEKFADSACGITVNVGQVQGGMATNVVAASARAGIDVRFERSSDGEKIDRKFRSLVSQTPGVQLRLHGGIVFPPLELTPRNRQLCDVALQVAKEMGLQMRLGKTGGGSDGCFLSACGLGVLDGLGMEGGGAHAHDEHIVIDRLPVRAAFLTRLILTLTEIGK